MINDYLDEYMVKAERNGLARSVVAPCIDDDDATYWAMKEVLDRAADGDEVWAMGAITLSHVHSGRVVRTMDEKL